MAIPEIRPEWMDEAACCNRSELFFPEGNDYSDVDEARKICKGCVVWRKCLSYAVTTKQPFGVWAGSTPTQRRAIRSKWLKTREIDEQYKGSPSRL